MTKQLSINAATHYCAVLGQPIRHSASPAMQNAALTALGLNWRYLAFEVAPQNLSSVLKGCQAMQFIGLNLTVPHKLLAVKLVDVLDESAQVWGAVNTIRFEAKNKSGQWIPLAKFSEAPTGEIRTHGFNTDADAIIRSLKEDLGVKLTGAKVILLGAGGAGRVAALKLAQSGVSQLFLINRTRAKAEAIAAEIKRRNPKVSVTVGYPKPTTAVDLLVNATSLGLKTDDALPWNSKLFQLKNATAIYDLIYRPAETKLLKAAKKAGCKTANGVGMLLYQGAKALEIWTGKKAPIEVMRAALLKNIYGL